MSRSPIRAAFCLAILALLPCCGGGSGGGDDDEPGIDAISPSTFFSEISEPMTVFGLGFGPPAAATVRLTAAAGTPFVGGTAAFVDVPVIVPGDVMLPGTVSVAEVPPMKGVPADAVNSTVTTPSAGPKPVPVIRNGVATVAGTGLGAKEVSVGPESVAMKPSLS